MPDERDNHQHDGGFDHETNEPYCGQPMEVHFAALLQIVVRAGASFECRDVYRALVEVAETYRKIGGFHRYEAKEGGVSEQVARGWQQAQAQRAALANDTPALASVYAGLSAEEKKKFH